MSVAYDYSPMSIDTPFGEGWGCLHTMACTAAHPQACVLTTPCATACSVAARPPRFAGHVLRWGLPSSGLDDPPACTADHGNGMLYALAAVFEVQRPCAACKHAIAAPPATAATLCAVSASPLAQPSFTPAMFQERGQKAPQDPNLAADAAARDLQEQLDLSAASEQKASGVDGEAGAKPAAAAGSGADGQIPQQQPAGQQQEGAAQERQPPRHSGPTGIRVKCMTGRFQAMDLCGPMHAPTGLEAAFQAKVQLAGPSGSAGSQDRARPAKAQAGVQADGAAAPQRQPQAEARGDQAPAAAGGSLSGMSSQQQQQQQQQGAGIAQPAEGSAAAEAGNGLGSSQVPSAGAEAGVPAAAAQQSGQPTDAAGGQGGAGSSEAAASAGFPSPPVSFGAAPAPAAFQFGAVPDASTPPGNAARRASRQRHGRYAPGSTRGSHSPLGAAPSAVGSKAESRLGQAASMPMGQCEGDAAPADELGSPLRAPSFWGMPMGHAHREPARSPSKRRAGAAPPSGGLRSGMC